MSVAMSMRVCPCAHIHTYLLSSPFCLGDSTLYTKFYNLLFFTYYNPELILLGGVHGFPLFSQLLCLFQQSWGEERAGMVGNSFERGGRTRCQRPGGEPGWRRATGFE